jgi:hypothetical protein
MHAGSLAGDKLSVQQTAELANSAPALAVRTLLTAEPGMGGLEASVVGVALPVWEPLLSGAGEPLAVVWMKRQRVP